MHPDRFERLVARHGIEYDLSEVFERRIEGLLTYGNQKVAKGTKEGWLTAVLHLAPAKASGFQVCSSATKGCEAACLNTAGRGGIVRKGETDNAIQKARRRKTAWYMTRRNEFLEALEREINRHVAKAAKEGLRPSIRLNGTSDIKWENVTFGDGSTIFDRFPEVQFYDYTKHPGRSVPSNYHLTFSLAESNDSEALKALENGVNVAAVFRDMPTEYLGRPVIDGDVTDLRFTDPSGVIVGLKAKGKARSDCSGFVR